MTAVLLTVGEPCAARALASVRRQTFGPLEVIRIGPEVRPFHRAMNEAAARVRTEFFLQLDADMVLNDWCVEELRAAAGDDVGMAVGSLWDPLMGPEAGVKLFRTQCVRRLPFCDTVSPDTHFNHRLPEHGWRCAYVVPSRHREQTPWPTFGRHEPDYGPSFTFSRYHLIGMRCRRRRDFAGFLWRYEGLRRSDHPLALLARIALAAGVFRDEDRDCLSPSFYRAQPLASWLHHFLDQASVGSEEGSGSLPPTGDDLETAFSSSHEIGARCREAIDPGAFRRCLDVCDRLDGAAMWYRRIGLHHGLVFGTCTPERLRAASSALRELLGDTGTLDGPHAERLENP